MRSVHSFQLGRFAIFVHRLDDNHLTRLGCYIHSGAADFRDFNLFRCHLGNLFLVIFGQNVILAVLAIFDIDLFTIREGNNVCTTACCAFGYIRNCHRCSIITATTLTAIFDLDSFTITERDYITTTVCVAFRNVADGYGSTIIACRPLDALGASGASQRYARPVKFDLAIGDIVHIIQFSIGRNNQIILLRSIVRGNFKFIPRDVYQRCITRMRSSIDSRTS